MEKQIEILKGIINTQDLIIKNMTEQIQLRDNYIKVCEETIESIKKIKI